MLSSVYRFATWFIPSMRGRLVLLEGLGFRANAHQSEQIALHLQGMAHGDWLIVYYLAQSMDKTNFYNFLVQVIIEDLEYENSHNLNV